MRLTLTPKIGTTPFEEKWHLTLEGEPGESISDLSKFRNISSNQTMKEE